MGGRARSQEYVRPSKFKLIRLKYKRQEGTRLNFRHTSKRDGESMAQDTDPFYEKVGKRLRKARERAGMTQEVASGLLGMAQPNLSRIEQGKQGITLRDAQRFADLYRVGYDDLVTERSPLD